MEILKIAYTETPSQDDLLRMEGVTDFLGDVDSYGPPTGNNDKLLILVASTVETLRQFLWFLMVNLRHADKIDSVQWDVEA